MSLHHERAKDLFLAALERPPVDRDAFLVEACGDDSLLKQEVESLLEFHETTVAGAVEESGAPVFSPGDEFAGRYRMIARLGRGGMGEVWRAHDMVLGTDVAVKLIHAASPEAHERLLNEVRLARQITHPNVCRVFDVGEAAGWAFFTMELVEGEDLSSLLRRVTRLPSEKVVDIAYQLCAGLAAAHARGVLHRDLKPANVLVDNQGTVRISDFGIAIPRTAARLHSYTGTPGYMAPEQRSAGEELSERTDVYSLALVLYELLVGHHALSGRDSHSEPARPSTLVPNVDPRLERALMRALSTNPADRPPSAMQFAASLPPSVYRPATTHAGAAIAEGGRRGTWWLGGSLLAAAVVVLAVAASFVTTSTARTLTEQDTIVLADFENTTGEPVFDGTLKVALAVALEQTPFLRVFPDERARETLRLMQRSPDERITKPLAREIARRESLKALIAGSIVRLGSNYVIGLEAVNADTGDVMAREQAEAARKEDVLTALGAASARLREKLGESLASVQRFDVPLPRATTPSLEALHAYSLALDEGREVPRLESIPHLKRAIELDPTFAMAHAQLSGVYTNTGQSSLAPAFSRQAFELRDRVSERERYFISWRYYRDATQDMEKALDLARSWTATYPREAFAFNSLGAALLRLGQFQQSVEPFETAIRLDPQFVPAYTNLAATYLALNRADDARKVLEEASTRGLEFAGARRLSYLIAFVQGDQATMARDLESSVGVTETNAAFGWQAHADAFGGRAQAAHEQFHRGVEMALQGKFNDVASQLTMEDAEIHAIFGQCEETRKEVERGLELTRNSNSALERASRALGLCGDAPAVAALTAELTKQFPESTLTRRAAVPIAHAALALASKDPGRVLNLLEPVKPYSSAPSTEFWPAYLRGQALLRLNNADAAAAEFESILDRRGEVPASPFLALARLGVARAAVAKGDVTSARASYQQFFDHWEGADQELQALRDARSEFSRLR